MNQNRKSASKQLRIAFIKARWHADIVDSGYQGFRQAMEDLTENQVALDVFDVPGAFEIPLFAKDLAKSGKYSAIIGCALVVDGGIYRHEFVADAVVTGLMTVQLQTDIPMLSVVLTPHSFNETNEHRQFFLDHFRLKGAEAANACLSITGARQSIAA
jgi:6,7-dimethyl-8-ribityllumazine synthase